MKKDLLLFGILIFIVSCDTFDLRLSIKNNTELPIQCKLLFKEEFIGGAVGSREETKYIKKNDSIKFGLLNRTWEGEFNLAQKDSLYVLIFNQKGYLDSFKGAYKYKKYSLQELKDLDFRVTYPDDGFKQGVFIK